jgi:hypothetical protein
MALLSEVSTADNLHIFNLHSSTQHQSSREGHCHAVEAYVLADFYLASLSSQSQMKQKASGVLCCSQSIRMAVTDFPYYADTTEADIA